ncbi:MAG: transposase [Polaribacter sp.]|nr:transposase [Polaribacter sp.]
MNYEILVQDSYYHIYNRGNNKEDIFFEIKNYDYFLNLLTKHTNSVCEILAYCLLKNHFHLVIKTKENIESKKISQSFSNFFNAYSKSINKLYNRDGSLFKTRFSRIKIDNEEYLKNIIIYVHLNPKHHQFVNDFRNYKFSSYQNYLINTDSNSNNNILQLFGGLENFVFCHQEKQELLLFELTLE